MNNEYNQTEFGWSEVCPLSATVFFLGVPCCPYLKAEGQCVNVLNRKSNDLRKQTDWQEAVGCVSRRFKQALTPEAFSSGPWIQLPVLDVVITGRNDTRRPIEGYKCLRSPGPETGLEVWSWTLYNLQKSPNSHKTTPPQTLHTNIANCSQTEQKHIRHS